MTVVPLGPSTAPLRGSAQPFDFGVRSTPPLRMTPSPSTSLLRGSAQDDTAAPPATQELDAPLSAAPQPYTSSREPSFAARLLEALDAASSVLGRADAAERAFAAGRGGLQEMVLERAQADVILAVAGAAASRVAQSLTTLLGMQV